MQDEVTVHFLSCKTKFAPLKASQTVESLIIPRLELCAALLLAQLLSHQLFVLCDIVIVDCVRAWSDSTIVLAWLNGDQKQFKIFVTNRVSKFVFFCHIVNGRIYAHLKTRQILHLEVCYPKNFLQTSYT